MLYAAESLLLRGSYQLTVSYCPAEESAFHAMRVELSCKAGPPVHFTNNLSIRIAYLTSPSQVFQLVVISPICVCAALRLVLPTFPSRR